MEAGQPPRGWRFAMSVSILLMLVGHLLVRFYQARIKIARLRQQGLPMPPWNPILGHVYFLYKITSKLPKDAHSNYIPGLIRQELPDLGPIFYIDSWPFGPQMLVVLSVEGLHQITQEHSLPKFPALRDFLHPIAGGMDLVTMEGETWRTWRGIFNPGFSASHLMTLIQGITEETLQFHDLLDQLSHSRKVFKMKSLTDNLTMDVIGRIVMNVKLDSQTQTNPLVDGLRSQVRWCTFGTEFKTFHPLRPFLIYRNSRRMDTYINRIIDQRQANLQLTMDDSNKGKKSILDLVLTAHLSGHDTTSSTVCYIFYTLANHPAILDRVRAEHTAVIGPVVSEAASAVSANPYLLNRLEYTTAVIKEVLRMYPAVSGTRAGEPGFCIIGDEQGRRFPTDGFLVWDDPQAIHRDDKYWPRANECVPERWLVPSGHPLYPVKGAWRPFSHGPRNCIGQELAMIEMKIIMVLTARAFQIETAYNGFDAGKKTRETLTVCGERGYQIQRAQPSEDLPCQVRLSHSK